MQEPTESSKQPIRAGHLGHVTGYQPIRDQYFMVRSVPGLCYHVNRVNRRVATIYLFGRL